VERKRDDIETNDTTIDHCWTFAKEWERKREEGNEFLTQIGEWEPQAKYERKKKGMGENLIMIATKSEMRDVRNNPNQIFVIILYKDTMLSTNDLTLVPLTVAHVLQKYNVVFSGGNTSWASSFVRQWASNWYHSWSYTS
jgi:hypothetical protein